MRRLSVTWYVGLSLSLLSCCAALKVQSSLWLLSSFTSWFKHSLSVFFQAHLSFTTKKGNVRLWKLVFGFFRTKSPKGIVLLVSICFQKTAWFTKSAWPLKILVWTATSTAGPLLRPRSPRGAADASCSTTAARSARWSTTRRPTNTFARPSLHRLLPDSSMTKLLVATAYLRF